MESTQCTLVLSQEERQKRLEEFHKGYYKNALDENLRKEKIRIIATLLECFNREMILADECLQDTQAHIKDEHRRI
jgi:hypothetical protein